MKLISTLLLSSLLALTACGGKSSGGDTTTAGTADTTKTTEPAETAAAGKTCDDVGANLSAQLQANGAPPDVISTMSAVAVSSCTEDAWSAEAVDCYASATDDATACEGTLTDAQKASLTERASAAMGGAEGMDDSSGM